ACVEGRYGNCVNVAAGDLSPGVQTGYCRDTGGGWSSSLVAHEVQLHPVPTRMADDTAVLTEPFSCALHAVLRAPADAHNILVIGRGRLGLLPVGALRPLRRRARVLAWAKHAHQQTFARLFGADEVLPVTKSSYDDLCKGSGATLHQPEVGAPTVLGGF